MLNWLYLIESTNLSHDVIQETILRELIDYIIGPNDLLREQVKKNVYVNYYIKENSSIL